MNLIITPCSIDQIKPPPDLLKEHPEHQLLQLMHSIEAFGFNDPIAVDEQDEIIEGTGRYLAAMRLQMTTLPVIRLQHLSEAQKRAYRIAHNKICLNTGFNLEALRIEFETLTLMDEILLPITGFETAELEELLKLPSLPKLGEELSEKLSRTKTLTCPHCGGLVYAS